MTILRNLLCAVLAVLLFAPCAAAHNREFPKLQGRWEFVVKTGDSQSQLNNIGPTTISTYLLQRGNSLINNVVFTTDTSECDQISSNNITVSNSTVNEDGQVVIVFTVNGDATQASFQYAFTGVLQREDSDEDEDRNRDRKPIVITGTYQKTAGGCTQGSLGTDHPDGEFVATYFPDLNGTWAGALVSQNVPKGLMNEPTTMTLETLNDHSLSGKILAPTLTSTAGIACFDGPITLSTGQTLTSSYAAGMIGELFGKDQSGTQGFMVIFSANPDGSGAALGEDNPSDGRDGTVNDGTNRELDVSIEVTGGPCGGLKINDQPFVLVHAHGYDKSERIRKNRH